MVCAHGGDDTDAPANTVRAFSAALVNRADCVEIDVARASDGVLLAMHVRELQQLAPGSEGMQVGDYSSAELRRLTWPSGDVAATVAEAVRLTSPHVREVILDLKPYYRAEGGAAADLLELCGAVAALLRSLRCRNCVVWGKSDDAVRLVGQLAPGTATGYVMVNGSEDARRQGLDRIGRVEDAQVVALHADMAVEDVLSQLHADGKRAHAWTINSEPDMMRVLSAGADGLVTNRVRDAVRVVTSQLALCEKTGLEDSSM